MKDAWKPKRSVWEWHKPLAHTFNPSTWEAKVDLWELEASLVYRVSFRTGSKSTEKSCLNKQTNKQTDKTQKNKNRK